MVFVLLLAILAKFAWKPISEGLDKRERHVADQIAQAEAANGQAKETLADYKHRLAAAGDQVRSILEQGRRHAEELSREFLEKAKHDAEAEHQRALRRSRPPPTPPRRIWPTAAPRWPSVWPAKSSSRKSNPATTPG